MRELIFEHITNGNDVYVDCLNAILVDIPRDAMADLGCNLAPHTPKFGFKQRVYMDILPRTLDYPEEQKYFQQRDILNIKALFGEKFDVSFALDVIEHLTINNGVKLIEIMKNISDNQILFTPLNDLFGMNYETDDPESHRSLWKPEMVELFFPNTFIYLTFPNFHKIWNGGAFYFYSCKSDLDVEFDRITNEINKFSWAK